MKQKEIYIVGDLHGSFGPMKMSILNYNISDCILICVGDLGVGFHHPNREPSIWRDLNSFFAEHNITFLSIRGNHDDPKYFCGPDRIVLSNLELVADYTRKTINGEEFLFVGGAISVDRFHRRPGTSYWHDETFVLRPELATQCDVLITHSAPLWNGPTDKGGISSWCDKDKTLWDECVQERKDHSSLIQLCTPKKHYCGHFHMSSVTENNGCVSTILNIDEIKQHNATQ
jgi:hypothetical protein